MNETGNHDLKKYLFFQVIRDCLTSVLNLRISAIIHLMNTFKKSLKFSPCSLKVFLREISSCTSKLETIYTGNSELINLNKGLLITFNRNFRLKRTASMSNIFPNCFSSNLKYKMYLYFYYLCFKMFLL